jgi:capsular polysaccharide biosynthesis protein
VKPLSQVVQAQRRRANVKQKIKALPSALLRILPRGWEFGPPRGWFSVAELLKSGQITGRLVADRQPEPDPARTALRKLSGLEQHYQWPREIFWSYHRRAELIGPSLLLRNDRNEVALEAAYGLPFVKNDPSYLQVRRPPATCLEGNWTSLISRWGDGFYHWMFDSLPRLALLPEWPADTRVLVPAKLYPYHTDTLNWLGLAGRYRPTSEQHLIVEHYYFSSQPAMTGCYNPYAASFLRETFLKCADAAYDPPKRFFVTRVGVSRGIANSDEVHRFFESRGWAVVDTAAMPLAQQIRLFAEADAICAVHGAALTNLAFCRPGCQVLELLADNFLNGVYEGLAEAVGLQYDFIVCPADSKCRAQVDLAELGRKLPA